METEQDSSTTRTAADLRRATYLSQTRLQAPEAQDSGTNDEVTSRLL
jgi:hypothetical protein